MALSMIPLLNNYLIESWGQGQLNVCLGTTHNNVNTWKTRKSSPSKTTSMKDPLECHINTAPKSKICHSKQWKWLQKGFKLGSYVKTENAARVWRMHMRHIPGYWEKCRVEETQH